MPSEDSPPSDGLHFIVMGANLLRNKGPAPELTLSQIFGFENEDISNSGLDFESMPEDFNMQNSQPPYSSFWRSPATAQNQTVQLRDFVLEAVPEIQETRIVDSDLEGQKHTTHDDDQLVAQYQPVLGATFEDLFNTCQHLPSAEEFTRPTNSNDFGLGDQDGHLFTGSSNQQLPLSVGLLRNSHGLPIAMILDLGIKMAICSLDGQINNYLCLRNSHGFQKNIWLN